MTQWQQVASALAALLCVAAEAGHPLLRPTSDVDVVYALGSPDGTIVHERLRWRASARQLRVDPPTQGLYVIIDVAARRMSTVQTAERKVIEMAAPDSAMGVPEHAASAAVRRGTDVVADLSCTEWDMADAAGQPTQVCLTDDGVLLRAHAAGRTLLTAEVVHYGPLDPTLFQPPAGYTHQAVGSRPGDSK